MGTKKQTVSFQGRQTRKSTHNENNKTCKHDYKNAIQIGNVDYVCPICKELLNPLEWFFTVNYNVKFVDCAPKKEEKENN